jgi:hypothetical protein
MARQSAAPSRSRDGRLRSSRLLALGSGRLATKLRHGCAMRGCGQSYPHLSACCSKVTT